MPNPTFPLVSEVVNQARKEASAGSAPIASALQQTELILRLRDLDAEGVSYPNSVGALGWWFNDREFLVSTIANTTNVGAVASGASSFTLTSGTGWDSPSSTLGAGYFRNGNDIFDFFAFESRSSAVLSTVNGIQMAHATLEEVHPLYKLPTNFGWPRGLFRESRSLTYLQRTASNRQIPLGGTYTIKYIASTSYNGLFLVFPAGIGALDWTLLYQLAAANVTLMTERLSLPGIGHGFRYYIEGLKEYIYHNEGESEDERKAAAQKMYHLEKLLDEYGIEDQSGEQHIIIPDA